MGGTRGSDPSADLSVHIQPRASRTEVVGWHGDAIKIRIGAPPVDGAANEELIRFLARHAGVPKRAIRIVSGATNRKKRLEVEGITTAQLLQALNVTTG